MFVFLLFFFQMFRGVDVSCFKYPYFQTIFRFNFLIKDKNYFTLFYGFFQENVFYDMDMKNKYETIAHNLGVSFIKSSFIDFEFSPIQLKLTKCSLISEASLFFSFGFCKNLGSISLEIFLGNDFLFFKKFFIKNSEKNINQPSRLIEKNTTEPSRLIEKSDFDKKFFNPFFSIYFKSNIFGFFMNELYQGYPGKFFFNFAYLNPCKQSFNIIPTCAVSALNLRSFSKFFKNLYIFFGVNSTDVTETNLCNCGNNSCNSDYIHKQYNFLLEFGFRFSNSFNNFKRGIYIDISPFSLSFFSKFFLLYNQFKISDTNGKYIEYNIFNSIEVFKEFQDITEFSFHRTFFEIFNFLSLMNFSLIFYYKLIKDINFCIRFYIQYHFIYNRFYFLIQPGYSSKNFV